jgi:hypothetical protein
MSHSSVPFTSASLEAWTQEERDSFYEAVDDSDYSLKDWVAALGAFQSWLEEHGELRRPWREIVGYIHCCTRMAAPGVALGFLKVIVYEALTEYGFEFTSESQS